MDDDLEYVHARLMYPSLDGDSGIGWVRYWVKYEGGSIFGTDGNGYETEAAALAAAKAFTIEHEREIAEAREDLSTISSVFTFGGDDEFDASLKRIYAREQAHLATLLAGWRTDADERKEAEDVE